MGVDHLTRPAKGKTLLDFIEPEATWWTLDDGHDWLPWNPPEFFGFHFSVLLILWRDVCS